MPYIKNETIVKLQNQQAGNIIVRPKFDNSLGHPIFFGKNFFDELLNIKNQEGASSVIKRNHNCLRVFEVQDCGVVEDIDYLRIIYK